MWFLIGLLFEDHSTIVDIVESFISFETCIPIILSSVAAPDSLYSDPDPAFSKWTGSGSRVLMTKMWQKIPLKKEFIFFWLKIAIYFALCLHKGRPSCRRSLQPSKENIQHFKKLNLFTFFNFCELVLPSWIRIQSGSFYPNLLRSILWETSNYLISKGRFCQLKPTFVFRQAGCPLGGSLEAPSMILSFFCHDNFLAWVRNTACYYR